MSSIPAQDHDGAAATADEKLQSLVYGRVRRQARGRKRTEIVNQGLTEQVAEGNDTLAENRPEGHSGE